MVDGIGGPTGQGGVDRAIQTGAEDPGIQTGQAGTVTVSEPTPVEGGRDVLIPDEMLATTFEGVERGGEHIRINTNDADIPVIQILGRIDHDDNIVIDFGDGHPIQLEGEELDVDSDMLYGLDVIINGKKESLQVTIEQLSNMCVAGGSGNDTIIFRGNSPIGMTEPTVYGNEGDDTLELQHTGVRVDFYGGMGIDTATDFIALHNHQNGATMTDAPRFNFKDYMLTNSVAGRTYMNRAETAMAAVNFGIVKFEITLLGGTENTLHIERHVKQDHEEHVYYEVTVNGQKPLSMTLDQLLALRIGVGEDVEDAESVNLIIDEETQQLFSELIGNTNNDEDIEALTDQEDLVKMAGVLGNVTPYFS